MENRSCMISYQIALHSVQLSGNRSFRQRVSSPTTSLPTYEVHSPMSDVSSPTPKICFEKDLKCSCKLQGKENVTFDVRFIVRFGLKMFVSLSPCHALSPHAMLITGKLIDDRSYFKFPRLFSVEYQPLSSLFIKHS